VSEQPTIHQSLAAVMSDIGAVAKGDRNTQQNFSFRGIDSVVNAVGPKLREHKVVMVPEAGEPTVDHYQSKGGAQMTHVLLPVTFTFWGPAGDSLSCRVIGEAADAGDKVMSKAHSVAWRIALLQTFAIPTDDPDPDSQAHERAPAPPPVDWPSLGWDDKDEHDKARSAVQRQARALPEPAKSELKQWISDQGWTLPYRREQMDAWQDRVAAMREDKTEQPALLEDE